MSKSGFCNCAECVKKRGGTFACSTCEYAYLTEEEANDHGKSHFVYRRDIHQV